MNSTRHPAIHRRRFLAASAALGATAVAGSAAAQAVDPYTGQPLQGAPAAGAAPDAGVVQYDTLDNRRNQSSFRMHDWRPYFDNLSNGAILVDSDLFPQHLAVIPGRARAVGMDLEILDLSQGIPQEQHDGYLRALQGLAANGMIRPRTDS